MRGLPPVYLRTQQLSWLEITPDGDGPCLAQLQSARVELPGATRLERFMAASRNPHSSAPCSVAFWPDGPDWPADPKHVRNRRHLRKHLHRRLEHAQLCGEPANRSQED
jgi:hypothetical protein